jgi:hypothetical protein
MKVCRHISFKLKSFELKRLDAASTRGIHSQRKPFKTQVLSLILAFDLERLPAFSVGVFEFTLGCVPRSLRESTFSG